MGVQERITVCRVMVCDTCRAEYGWCIEDLMVGLPARAREIGWKSETYYEKLLLKEKWACPVCVQKSEAARSNQKIDDMAERISGSRPETPAEEPIKIESIPVPSEPPPLEPIVSEVPDVVFEKESK